MSRVSSVILNNQTVPIKLKLRDYLLYASYKTGRTFYMNG